MYHFIYWYFYEYFRQRSRNYSTIATLGASLTIIIHLILIYTIVWELTGLPHLLEGIEFIVLKLVLFVSVISLFYKINLSYFKKQKLKILSKYRGESVNEGSNIFFSLSVLVVPLLLIFVLYGI